MELHINFLTTTLAILFDFVGTLFKRELVWGVGGGGRRRSRGLSTATTQKLMVISVFGIALAKSYTKVHFSMFEPLPSHI